MSGSSIVRSGSNPLFSRLKVPVKIGEQDLRLLALGNLVTEIGKSGLSAQFVRAVSVSLLEINPLEGQIPPVQVETLDQKLDSAGLKAFFQAQMPIIEEVVVPVPAVVELQAERVEEPEVLPVPAQRGEDVFRSIAGEGGSSPESIGRALVKREKLLGLVDPELLGKFFSTLKPKQCAGLVARVQAPEAKTAVLGAIATQGAMLEKVAPFLNGSVLQAVLSAGENRTSDLLPRVLEYADSKRIATALNNVSDFLAAQRAGVRQAGRWLRERNRGFGSTGRAEERYEDRIRKEEAIEEILILMLQRLCSLRAEKMREVLIKLFKTSENNAKARYLLLFIGEHREKIEEGIEHPVVGINQLMEIIKGILPSHFLPAPEEIPNHRTPGGGLFDRSTRGDSFREIWEDFADPQSFDEE
ncbi:hypothetical protein A2276_08520 [candidate division WOR-1 bacterium RIFOXYA12_FULL_43_27]|uniref:Uncharacterized protein n=1 Tax=candidate division WOR-1 bacterium RIFOXYC2_FULL_46_14 TaxID=1802587 RepID=A0A1F4U6A0_UNCSA|nr:MAG: hypothetical protein A2276_08520 [candidate division WOR-1 bacterium RIFOXYA12_FULL_43_27]OGC20635.1 MAG: hypothetical protein A2292_06345 [candidate division WOR-1 bacterium RIFOXYB2_FULL_46_45]OGC31628.1 MAG: hypothetical protein A2232_05105 [candidate division WOR-1 bacterium RIFOXYA2_FULL_46_56]OGC40476.1 MAG: hypothetical protein A2438_04375 [candidate division WOR-1 bacterium RIFOXYC2_FULL_46_14]